MGVLDKLRRKKGVEEEQVKAGSTFEDYPHLVALKPNEKYVFRSDYYEVDDFVGCVLGFFHSDAAQDNFPAFWGINRIPMGLGDEVTTILLEQVHRRGEKWVQDHLKRSDQLDKLGEREQNDGATSSSSRRRQAKIADDMDVVAGELQDGAAYLQVHNRLVIKAPDLATLDESIERIGRLFIEHFGTLSVAAYAGEQKQELSGLWRKNSKKRGKGFHYTSTELAGAHSLVTNGLNDPTGEYVGYMVGDVNNSAVVVDMNLYESHVVVADNARHITVAREYASNMWASKISQSCLMNNGRVVHIVLDGADLNTLGPRFENITSRVDLNSGDVNMFELFGDQSNELSLFPAHLKKLELMVEQAYEPTDSDRSIIRGMLSDILTQFYVDEGMWYVNAVKNRDRLRLVNLPHDHVPRLESFILHLNQRRQALVQASARDDDELHAFTVLLSTFRGMLDNNGDLFNTTTQTSIDSVRDNPRVVYDFSRLLRRGRGVAMAQLVNIIGFAVESMGEGDTVIIHGTEDITEGVKGYIEEQFEHMRRRGGRVAYVYNSIEKMIADRDFNKLEGADYTVLGGMTEPVADSYQKVIKQEIPTELYSLITTRGENLSYFRRGVDNVVFWTDLMLGKNARRKSRRLIGSSAERERQVDAVSQAQEKARAKRNEENGPLARFEAAEAKRKSKTLEKSGGGRRAKSRPDARRTASKTLDKTLNRTS